MELIRTGVIVNNELITLKDLIDKSTTSWEETEWEFPKGRRNFKEKDLECALREFEEETGILSSKISIVENVLPFEEIFIGTNHKSYKHKYFLAYMNEPDEYLNNFQVTEVSKIEWKSLEQCLEAIRPYNLEKKELIININKVLQEYRLYS
jgi:8-oxo-dGTP pyrophosphatase MutT (NUDIX family)